MSKSARVKSAKPQEPAVEAPKQAGKARILARRFTWPGSMQGGLVRGVFTTEFLVAVAIIAAATVALVMDRIDANVWIDTLKWVGAGYGLSRGIAKAGAAR